MQAKLNPSADFWRGKRVLITGHTGFKGAWLAFWLHQLGAKCLGLALAPNSESNLYALLDLDQKIDSRIMDIRGAAALQTAVKEFQPEVVLHLAAQALVRPSYAQPVETFASNVMGTAHVLEAMRQTSSVKAAVMVTTDKVYHNQEWFWPYRETDALGGHDPYSASKAACEIVIQSYVKSFFADRKIPISSARAGNVIGGGDWSEDRLIPDAVRAWENNKPLEIRSPESVRPWQHVLEPLCAYLLLAEKTYHNPSLAGAYNFGPHANEAATVRQVIDLARTSLSSAQVNYAQTAPNLHEAKLLALDTAKARSQLNIAPRLNLSETVEMTMTWYQKLQSGQNASVLCQADIEKFCA